MSGLRALALAIVASVALTGAARRPATVFDLSDAVGKPAPAVTLTASDGSPLALGALRGKPTYVFLFAGWCGPCQEAMPFVRSAYAKYGDRVRFVGVDVLEDADAARTAVATRRAAVPGRDLPDRAARRDRRAGRAAARRNEVPHPGRFSARRERRRALRVARAVASTTAASRSTCCRPIWPSSASMSAAPSWTIRPKGERDVEAVVDAARGGRARRQLLRDRVAVRRRTSARGDARRAADAPLRRLDRARRAHDGRRSHRGGRRARRAGDRHDRRRAAPRPRHRPRAARACAIAWAGANGKPALSLRVFPDNERAVALYRANGFVEVELQPAAIPRRDGPARDAIVMRRPVTQRDAP